MPRHFGAVEALERNSTSVGDRRCVLRAPYGDTADCTIHVGAGSSSCTLRKRATGLPLMYVTRFPDCRMRFAKREILQTPEEFSLFPTRVDKSFPICEVSEYLHEWIMVATGHQNPDEHLI
ncbi:hypothetical protein N7462_000377 [Penicillium macrosclerotiorum]|uniref:uncharacterized protein n=1 Tax=Penicillium macrosclerotiorum TaxID=303699 RepID=UPI002547536A|nr:uncharacterized protein N7462_000377 [Penicillium macrosclerotiorum]KAJ5698372.1 hypothetical protein N7462_000377 [Penicillium macrosclerotiorum]